MKARYAILSGALLFAVNAFFTWKKIYIQTPFLDVPMHFLGGCIVAWFFIACFKKEEKKMSRLAWPLLIIGGTAAVGVVWEFYEWTMDTFVFPGQFMGGLNDTLLDLAMDLLGACVVVGYATKKRP